MRTEDLPAFRSTCCQYVRVLSSLIIAISLAANGCGSDSSGAEYNSSAELQSLVNQHFAQFSSNRPGVKGTLGIAIRSPGGNFFASAGETYQGGAEAHFRGASTTKTFTAAAILLLHQEGRLDINSRVVDLIPGTANPYLPDTPEYAIPFKDEITIRALLEHRAGVFDITNSPIPLDRPAPYAGRMYIDYVIEELGETDHTFTFDELASVVSENQLFASAPGGPFQYSNTGYALLGKIIERVTELRYHTFMQTRFIEPLYLSETTFPYAGDDQHLFEPFVPGYVYYNQELYPVLADNFSGAVAEGNIQTTPHDLSRWIGMLLKGEAGHSQETLALMQAIAPTGENHQYYGLGLTYTEGLGYGHNGGHAGYLTVMRYNPLTDVSVVVFLSVVDFDAMYEQVDMMYEAARAAIAAAA